jgi:hypothetical protein
MRPAPTLAVIPGRREAANPQSRNKLNHEHLDSGSGADAPVPQ